MEQKTKGRAAAAACFLAASGLSTAWVSSASAGAWTLDEGRGQVIVTGLYSSASAIFGDHENDLRPIDFQKATAAIFGEYGLREGLTIVGEGEVGFESANASSAAVTNFALGARQRLFRSGGFVVSGQATARIDRDDSRAARPVSLDVAHPELEARMLAGYGFKIAGRSAFVDVQSAYRLALAERPDEAQLDLTLGFRPTEKVLLLVQTASTFSLGSDGGTSRYQYHKAGGSVVYDLNEHLAVQVGGFATVDGHNALRERGVTSALWYRF